MAHGHYPSTLVTGPRRIKNGSGYLMGYVFGSTGSADGIQFHKSTAAGTMIWRDRVPATTGEAARYTFPGNGLHFDAALYVTGASGADFPQRLFVIYQ